MTVVVAAQTPEFWPFSSDPDDGESSDATPAEQIHVSNAPDQDGYTGSLEEGITAAGEPSGSTSTDLSMAQPGLVGAQPDDIGYIGPLWNPETDQAEPSGTIDQEVPDWDSLMTGPQADVNDPLAPLEPEWSGFFYINAAGSTLKPRDSGQDWGNSGSGGCIYANTLGSEVMNLHLDIPTGSRIDYLRLFFYDTSASTSNAWVTTYDGASGFTDLTSVSSTGNTGYGTSLSAYVGHIVDNNDYSYVLNWRPNVTGNTMMLCGLRVAYRLP